MSHLNGFFVKGRWGKYFSIQTNTRDGGKVKTHHIRYVGKNALQLDKIRNLQTQDKDLMRAVPLEFFIDENGEHVITPDSIQEALDHKIANMGAIDQRTERWARKWAGKADDEEFTQEDLHNLVKDRINVEDFTTQSILNLTSKKGQEYLNNVIKIKELVAQEKAKADNFRVIQTENDEGETLSINSTNNEVSFEEDADLERKKQKELEAELPIKFNPLKQYEQINDILMNDFSKFENEEDNSDWFYLMQKTQGAEVISDIHLTKEDTDLIEKYFKLYGTEQKFKKVDTGIRETQEIIDLRAKNQAYYEQNKENIEHIVNLALNGQWDKLRVDMKIDYDHRHYKQDLECIYSDVKEYQMLKLVKQLTEGKLEGQDKVKTMFIRENLGLDSFDEIRNVYASHFSYKFGCEYIDSKGTKPIKLKQYEKGKIREFLNESTKSGYLLKQINREGERETSYVPNFIDTIHQGKTSLLRKAHFDVDEIKKQAKEIAKIKLESTNVGEKEYSETLRKETEKEQKKLMKGFETKAQEHVKELEKTYGKKFTNKKFEESVERAKNKLIRQFKEEFREKKLKEITNKRLADEKIKPGSKEYEEEFVKVKKWYEKKLKIETRREEFNLMRKYTLSKRSIARVLNHENLDFFEKVHKSNVSTFERKAKQEEGKRGRELTKEEKSKLYFRQNINKMFGEYIKESREIEKVRAKQKKTKTEEEFAKKKTLYDRGVKNLQEFSFMLHLASMDRGAVLEGTRTALEVFDVSQVFNANRKLKS